MLELFNRLHSLLKLKNGTVGHLGPCAWPESGDSPEIWVGRTSKHFAINAQSDDRLRKGGFAITCGGSRMPDRGNTAPTNALSVARSKSLKPRFSLYSHYDTMFETRLADSPLLREECFRIRHEVYCIERGYLDSNQKHPGLECDSYDERSAHSLLYDRASGVAVGTIRLILAEGGSPVAPTPFHSLCQDRLAQRPELAESRTAEVSRLALSKCRCEGVSSLTANKRRSTDLADIHSSSCVALGLLRMAIEMAVANRVDYLCAVMEPSLLRMLARCGIYFQNLGSRIDYHGMRQPCSAHLITMLDGIEADRPDVWEVMTDLGRFHPDRPGATGLVRKARNFSNRDTADAYPLRAVG